MLWYLKTRGTSLSSSTNNKAKPSEGETQAVGKGGKKDRIEARRKEILAKINMYENLIQDYTASNKPQ